MSSEHHGRRASQALRSVAELLEGLRLAIETNREEAARLLEAMAQRVDEGLRRGREAQTFPYKGKMLTAAQLAKLAGVHRTVMRERLKRHTAEESVARGARKFTKGPRDLYELHGEKLSVRQLAERAGVSWVTMWQRLRKKTPAEAMLPNQRRRAAPAAAPTPTPAPSPAPSPAPTAAPRRAIRITPTEQLLAIPPTPTRAPTPAPTPAPALEPTTVIARPLGRYEVAAAPSIFGRIGSYPEPPRSAAARALKR